MPDTFERLKAALADRYAIEREIGAGGMATVYLAEDLKHHRKVAVKVLRPELATAIGSKRFLREIQIAAQLQHPHILPLYDSGSTDRFLYYVMPYVEGETLGDRLRRDGALPASDAVSVGADIASALEYAHQKGIVHRDIKPDNIMLSASGGHASVADFGIARAVSAAQEDTLTGVGVAIGTPGYMPPEQLEGGAVTPATDIYATGLVVYEALTGRRWADTLESGDRWVNVPGRLVDTLTRAAAHAPNDRWPNAAAFRRALIEGYAKPRIHRTVVAGVAAAVVLLAGFAAWFAVRDVFAPGTSPSRVAVLPFSVRGSAEFDYLREGMVDLLSTRLDGVSDLRVSDPRAILARTAGQDANAVSPESSMGVARALGADLFILGSVVEARGQLRMDASLYDLERGRDAIAHSSAEGDADDLFALVDAIAAEILVGRDQGPASRVNQIAARTTASLAALKAYLDGERAYRAAQYAEAVEALQLAVSLDSTFALAWHRLSAAAQFLVRPDLSQTAADRAIEYADKLSERDRRVLDAMQAERTGDAAAAEALYRAILEVYPDDVESWLQLGEVLFHYTPLRGRSPTESRRAWEQVIRFDPNHATALLHLARVAALEGDHTWLKSLVDQVTGLGAEASRASDMRVLRAFTTGTEDEQSQVLAELESGTDRQILVAAGYVAAFVNDQRGAASLARLLTSPERPPETRALGHVLIAYLEVAGGRWTSANAELSRAAAYDPTTALLHSAMLSLTYGISSQATLRDSLRWDLVALDIAAIQPSLNRTAWFSALDGVHAHVREYLVGSLAAVARDTTAARQHANMLSELPSTPHIGSLPQDLARSVQSRIADAGGRNDEALALLVNSEGRAWWQLQSFSPLFSLPHERYRLAQLLEEAERYDEALTSLATFEAFSLFDQIYVAPAHLARARILERIGRPTEAATHYRRVLRLWADSDPAYRALVQEAEEGLARAEGAS